MKSLIRQKDLNFNPRNLPRLRSWPLTPFCSPFLFCSRLSSKLKEGQCKSRLQYDWQEDTSKESQVTFNTKEERSQTKHIKSGLQKKAKPCFLKSCKAVRRLGRHATNGNGDDQIWSRPKALTSFIIRESIPLNLSKAERRGLRAELAVRLTAGILCETMHMHLPVFLQAHLHTIIC